MLISPALMFSRPASIRKRVDFPHPDGPTNTVNEPSGISIETPLKIRVDPKDFFTSSILTRATSSTPNFFLSYNMTNKKIIST
jgi:hypothetical protein